jgi:Zn-dependent peptidase ImmA (M78 family)
MEAAIQELQRNPELSLRAVAKKYGIPRTSFQFKLKNPGHKESLVHHQFFRMKNKR